MSNIRISMTRDRFDWILSGLDDDKLTMREAEFVESCEKGFEKYGKLTEAMEDWLEAIYKEKEK